MRLVTAPPAMQLHPSRPAAHVRSDLRSDLRTAAVGASTRGAADSDSDDTEVEAGAASLLRRAAERGEREALMAALALCATSSVAIDDVEAAGGLTPLHAAARSGNALCVKALLDAGADGNKQSHRGNRPLAVACKHSQWAAAGALLEGGVGADAVAMLQAVRHAAGAEIQSRLCAAGGLVAADANGRTALMTASATADARR